MAIFLDLPFWRTAIRGLGALLCNIIYNLISWIYQLFITVSRLNILSSDGVAPIYQRVTMILTIVMTFYITFEFVKYVIQPDTITDKEKGAGNILKRIIIVVVLIAFVPRLFTLAYRAQNIIIENQVISKVILGKKNVNFATFGNDFSANLLSIFYDVNESACQSGCNEEREIVNSNLDGLRKGEGLNLTQGIENSVSQSGEKIPTIRFDGILAIGVGVFILYILILYSIDVGIRYFQLLFLQIIAPIAIMGYMLPKKDNIFEKWYKQCFSTYIDLFLRLAIIYFVLMIVQVLGDAMNAGTLFAGMDDVSGSIRTFAYIVLVMGLLAFAQRAPKLLGELFPSMGSKAGIGFGLKAAERVAPGAARGIGATLAATKLGGQIGKRMLSNHFRNKANGKHSPLTEAGRNENRQRRANRRRASDLADLSESTQELNETENELRTANRRLDEAKKRDPNNKEEIDRLTKERDEALEKYKSSYKKFTDNDIYKNDLERFKTAGRQLQDARKELEAANRSGDATRIANAQMELTRAQNHFNLANENMDQYRKETAESARNRLANKEYRDMQSTKEYQDVLAANRKVEVTRENLEIAKGTQNQSLIDAAQLQYESAQNDYEAARERLNNTDEMKKYRESIIRPEERNLNTSLQELKEARDNLEKAKKSGDVDSIITATNNLRDKETNYSAAQKKYFEVDNNRTNLAENLQSEVKQAQEQVIEDDNKAYKSMAGAVIGGTVGTIKNVIATGATATKLEDVTKKVKEGVQKDNKEIQEINKYYDAGGAGGIEGMINRTVQQIEKNIGVETQYQRTVLQNKALEPQIKNLEAQSSLAKDIKSTADGAEDRLKDKIEDLNLAAESNTIKTGLKTRNANGELVDEYAEVSNGETIADVYRKYKGRSASAKAEAESAAKSLETFESQNAKILSSDKSTLTGSSLDKYNSIISQREKLKNTANEKATMAANLEYALTQIQKNGARYEYSKILNDMASGVSLETIKANDKYDQVAVEKVRDALESIKVARQNPTIVEDMKNRLSSDDYQAFLSGKILSFKQLDNIKTAAINAGNEYERALKNKKEEKRSSETSNQTAAQKAANDFNGSSGK